MTDTVERVARAMYESRPVAKEATWEAVTDKGIRQIWLDLAHAAIAAMQTWQPEECAHEWTDATNEVVQSGEICLKCNAVRAAPPEASE